MILFSSLLILGTLAGAPVYENNKKNFETDAYYVYDPEYFVLD